MENIKIRIICLFLSILLFNTGYARSKETIKYSHDHNHWYISLNSGISSFIKPDNHNTLDPTFKITDHYKYKKNKIKPTISIGTGYQWERDTRFWLPSYSLGLRYSYYFQYQGEGDFIMANTNPSSFTYNMQSQALLMMGKLFILKWHNIKPFIVGGIGAALNRFSDYKDPGTTVWAGNTYNFANKSTINFAYLVGLGASYKFNKNWQLGVEYHYANLGKSKTGKNQDGTTIPINLAEQSVLLTVSYHFL